MQWPSLSYPTVREQRQADGQTDRLTDATKCIISTLSLPDPRLYLENLLSYYPLTVIIVSFKLPLDWQWDIATRYT